MAGQKQPINLVIAKNKKHLTKQEIAERQSTEVKPIAENIQPPPYLLKKQKEEFMEIAGQLQALKIMGDTDIDALGRYILSKDIYIKLCKQIRSSKVMNDPILLDKYMKNQDRAFRQCRACANDLGLTITSRCRLVAPAAPEEKKANKFNKFDKGRTG